MKKQLLIAAVLCSLAFPAFATDEWTQCGGGSAISQTTAVVTTHGCAEYQWTNGTGALTIRVTADYARIFFDSNIASGSVPGSPAELMVQLCAQGLAVSDNTCGDILDSTLTGLEGAAGTQRMSVRVPYGIYRLVQSVAPSSVVALIQVQGE